MAKKIGAYYIAGGCEIDLSVNADAVRVVRSAEAVILDLNNLSIRLPHDVAHDVAEELAKM